MTEYETEFSEFPKDWEVKKLKDIITYKKGVKPKQLYIKRIDDNYVPYLTAEYLRGQSEPRYVDMNEKRLLVAEPEDILMIWDGSAAGDLFTGFRGAVASTFVRIKCNRNIINCKYLYYYLLERVDILKKRTKGTGIPHINKDTFENLQIPLPPLEEQKKIVEILNTVDFIITVTTNLIKKLRVIKEKTLNLLITGSIWHKEFIKTDIGRFPKEWEVKRLSEIAELQRGLSYSGSEKSKDEIPDGYLFLTLNSVKEGGGLKEDGWTWIKSDRLKERHFVREGDIVIANTDIGMQRGHILGAPAIVNFPEWYKKDKAVFSHHISKLLLKVSNLDVNFLFYYLSFVQPLARKYHTGTGVWGLNVDSWAKELPIPIPPLEEQKKIVEILLTIDNKIETETKYLDYMKKLKEKLLAALMTGKIRVNSIAIGDLK